jgi:limonene-1,2-epoxide hydrolase
MSTGMVDGSEIRTVVSNDDTVVVERVDINIVIGKQVTFHVTAIFEVRHVPSRPGASTGDTGDAAPQLGIDPSQMFQHIGGQAVDTPAAT